MMKRTNLLRHAQEKRGKFTSKFATLIYHEIHLTIHNEVHLTIHHPEPTKLNMRVPAIHQNGA